MVVTRTRGVRGAGKYSCLTAGDGGLERPTAGPDEEKEAALSTSPAPFDEIKRKYGAKNNRLKREEN